MFNNGMQMDLTHSWGCSFLEGFDIGFCTIFVSGNSQVQKKEVTSKVKLGPIINQIPKYEKSNATKLFYFTIVNDQCTRKSTNKIN
jgi:hypothetical protein